MQNFGFGGPKQDIKRLPCVGFDTALSCRGVVSCQAVITTKLGAPSSLLSLRRAYVCQMNKPRYLAFTHRIRTKATGSGSNEQAALFATACANACLIQGLVTNAEASKGVCIGGQEFVVDAILCAERALLEIRGVKEAARRFNDLGERREEKSAGPADRLPGGPLQPFMRAYYMLHT